MPLIVAFPRKRSIIKIKHEKIEWIKKNELKSDKINKTVANMNFKTKKSNLTVYKYSYWDINNKNKF